MLIWNKIELTKKEEIACTFHYISHNCYEMIKFSLSVKVVDLYELVLLAGIYHFNYMSYRSLIRNLLCIS